MFKCYEWIKKWTSTPSAGISETGSPLPRTQHVSLPLSQIRKRLLIISDVHGCLEELERLLKKVDFKPETMTVILVGDLVAKGPKSLEVVRFLMNQKSMMSVRGNHEDNALLAYHHPHTSKYAKRKVYDFVQQLSTEEVSFIQELPVSISIPEMALLIVHGGVDPGKRGVPVNKHSYSDLIRIRCVLPDGTTTKDPPDDESQRKLWGPLYVGPPFVVFGHDAKRGLQVHPWARGIDTGCCHGGSLTGILIDDTRAVHDWIKTMQLISVSASRTYSEPGKDD